MSTLSNFGSGISGGILMLFGFFLFFVEPLVGICIFVGGLYLKYKSETHVHN